jgi:hypothetical protein
MEDAGAIYYESSVLPLSQVSPEPPDFALCTIDSAFHRIRIQNSTLTPDTNRTPDDPDDSETTLSSSTTDAEDSIRKDGAAMQQETKGHKKKTGWKKRKGRVEPKGPSYVLFLIGHNLPMSYFLGFK